LASAADTAGRSARNVIAPSAADDWRNARRSEEVDMEKTPER